MLRLSRHQWFALVGVWLVILSGNWAAEALRELASILSTGQGIGWSVAAQPGLLLLVLVLSSLWVYRHRAVFGGAYGISRQLCSPHDSVVLLVSTSSIALGPTPLSFPMTLQAGDVSVTLEGKSLEDDIDALNELPSNRRWNWQQLLRAITPHKNRVRRVRLVGSPGSGGSFEQLPFCAAMLARYLPNAKIVMATRPVSFEDFNELVDLIRLVIREERNAGIKAKDIVIDITGGQKTASIAAAAATFNSAVTFQYVQTSAPYDVYSYDLVWQSPISLEE